MCHKFWKKCVVVERRELNEGSLGETELQLHTGGRWQEPSSQS